MYIYTQRKGVRANVNAAKGASDAEQTVSLNQILSLFLVCFLRRGVRSPCCWRLKTSLLGLSQSQQTGHCSAQNRSHCLHPATYVSHMFMGAKS